MSPCGHVTTASGKVLGVVMYWMLREVKEDNVKARMHATKYSLHKTANSDSAPCNRKPSVRSTMENKSGRRTIIKRYVIIIQEGDCAVFFALFRACV